MEKKPLIEAVKEAGRYAVFTAISVFLTTLLDKVKGIENQEVLVLVLTITLRFLDKYLHIKRKYEMPGRAGESLGLLKF